MEGASGVCVCIFRVKGREANRRSEAEMRGEASGTGL